MSETLLKKDRGSFFGVLQRVGRAFMLPIALLPIAGLLLGIGSSFTNIAMLETYKLIGFMGPGTFLYSAFTLLASVGTVIFDNLPLLFAMGVALGMANQAEKALEGGSLVLNITLFAVLVYELIGPFLTKKALEAAGEIKPEGKTSARHEHIKTMSPEKQEKHLSKK